MTPQQNSEVSSQAQIQTEKNKKPFVCPVDPAELEQCDSCQ